MFLFFRWPKIELSSGYNQKNPKREVNIINEAHGHNCIANSGCSMIELKNMFNDENQKDISSLFYGKFDANVEFYQQLMVLFRGKVRA